MCLRSRVQERPGEEKSGCSTNTFSAVMFRFCLPFGIRLGCLKSPVCRDETLAFRCLLGDCTRLADPRDLREQGHHMPSGHGGTRDVSLEWGMSAGG